MKVAFLGASKFGSRCLRALLELRDLEVVGVVTAPQRFAISYRRQGVVNVLHADLMRDAAANKVPGIVLVNGMNDLAVLEQVAAWGPDLFVVVGWYHMVPKQWRRLAPAYGLHASLLPDYSGGAPLVWAMINGEKETGITLFRLDDGVDNGPVVAQRRTDIREDETIATLYARIEEIGLAMLIEQVPHIAAGTAQLTPQVESRRRLFPQRGPEDGLIDWKRDAREVFNFIRAQTDPYPGAFTTLDGHKLTIWSARLHPDARARAAGEALENTTGTLVQTGRDAIELLQVTWDGQPMAGRELRALVRPGAVFGR